MEATMSYTPYTPKKFTNGELPGVWHYCSICHKKRLESSLAFLTYRIPSIRNIERTIRYCKDDEECTYQALARKR